MLKCYWGQFESAVKIYVKLKHKFRFTLFMIYLMMVSIGQTRYRRLVGWLVNNDLERMWKEAALAKFEVIIQVFAEWL
jgi:hypothetical protein